MLPYNFSLENTISTNVNMKKQPKNKYNWYNWDVRLNTILVDEEDEDDDDDGD